MDSPVNQKEKVENQQERIQKGEQKNDIDDELKGGQASRRSRKDVQGRDFVCGCGKKYLSYPALYTHIKTKHDGRQPEGTMKYSTVAPAKKTKTKLQEEHIAQLASLVTREDVRLLQVLGQKFSGSTSVSHRLKSKILQKQITDSYHSLIKCPSSPLKLTKQSSLQQHLIGYLIGVGQFITQRLHQQYQLFARTVKQCYYQMGPQVYNKCFSKKQGGLCYVPNFRVQKVKYFPLICDFYIRFFLPYQYSELNSNLMELILTDFCHWLNRRKATFIQVVLNKQYKLNKPLEFQLQVKNQKSKRSPQEQQEKCDPSEIEDIDSEIRQNNKDASGQEQMKNQSQHQNNQNHLNGLDHLDSNLEIKSEPNQGEQAAPNPQRKQHLDNSYSIAQNRQNGQNLEDDQKKQIAENDLIGTKQNNNSFHGNWSLQVEPASGSSQELPPVPQNNQNIQSDVPQHEHQDQNVEADVHSDNA